eukprot:209509_1
MTTDKLVYTLKRLVGPEDVIIQLGSLQSAENINGMKVWKLTVVNPKNEQVMGLLRSSTLIPSETNFEPATDSVTSTWGFDEFAEIPVHGRESPLLCSLSEVVFMCGEEGATALKSFLDEITVTAEKLGPPESQLDALYSARVSLIDLKLLQDVLRNSGSVSDEDIITKIGELPNKLPQPDMQSELTRRKESQEPATRTRLPGLVPYPRQSDREFSAGLVEIRTMAENEEISAEDDEHTSTAKDAGNVKCNGCKKSFAIGDAFRCARCMKVSYCGPTCQRTDWQNHEKDCEDVHPKVIHRPPSPQQGPPSPPPQEPPQPHGQPPQQGQSHDLGPHSPPPQGQPEEGIQSSESQQASNGGTPTQQTSCCSLSCRNSVQLEQSVWPNDEMYTIDVEEDHLHESNYIHENTAPQFTMSYPAASANQLATSEGVEILWVARQDRVQNTEQNGKWKFIWMLIAFLLIMGGIAVLVLGVNAQSTTTMSIAGVTIIVAIAIAITIWYRNRSNGEQEYEPVDQHEMIDDETIFT